MRFDISKFSWAKNQLKLKNISWSSTFKSFERILSILPTGTLSKKVQRSALNKHLVKKNELLDYAAMQFLWSINRVL